jgi:hypothetical protein
LNQEREANCAYTVHLYLNIPVHAVARHACLKLASLISNLSSNGQVTAPGENGTPTRRRRALQRPSTTTSRSVSTAKGEAFSRARRTRAVRGERELKDFDEGQRLAKGVLLDRDQISREARHRDGTRARCCRSRSRPAARVNRVRHGSNQTSPPPHTLLPH